MGNQITFKQYRTIDVIILVALTIIFEAITTIATNKWFALQPVALSIGLAMTCVAMMRWSWQAAFLAFAGGFTFCAMSGASTEQFLVYCVGNIGAMSGMVWFKVFGKECVRSSIAKVLLFVTTAYIGMVLGRGIISIILGDAWGAFVQFAAKDSMTLVFAAVVILLFRKTDGLLEDQKAYLLRLDRERKETQDEPVREEEY